MALYGLDFTALESLKNGKNVSLKGLEKSLNFWSKKVYEPWLFLLAELSFIFMNHCLS